MNKNIEVIKKRLARYEVENEEERMQVIQEITQEIFLASLSETSFFDNALRILYGIDRYSEDLDFHLITKDSNYQWKTLLQNIKDNMVSYGFP
jgi:hypothetical protein